MLLLNSYLVLIFLILPNKAPSLSSQTSPVDGLSISVPSKTTKMTLQSIFTVRINEKGHTYHEMVKIDTAQHIEYFFVPPHENTNGADFILDFKKNLTLIRIPTQRMCYVRRAIDDVPKPQKLQKDLLQPLRLNEGVTTRILKWRVSGTLRNKRILDKKMKQLCKGMPVFLITPDTGKPARGQIKGIEKRLNCGGRICYSSWFCYLPCFGCEEICQPTRHCSKITC